MMLWFIAAALILILELFIGTVYLLVVSAALFGAGIAAFLFNSFSLSMLIAAVLSAVGIWWAHGWLQRHRHSDTEESARNDLDIGQTVQITRHLHDSSYEVHYRGTLWQAQAQNAASSDAPVSQTAVIVGKNGNTLLIQLH
ncbi:NfeD family protein [Neisseria montereyensis]|uniref:NfeD family protein n=1 Tax=Neisseria montereyensis TaxID=2973938 RepID=A0ABT2F9V6_9NEIS|nr:NfeD family protein [Neisseria montereyensis]MCS4532974.1 NfeD family protein [Neisseria montereyensis]